MEAEAGGIRGSSDTANAFEEPAGGTATAASSATRRTAARLTYEGELGLHLGVLGERGGPRQMQGAARRIEPIGPGLQPRRDVGRVADNEVSGVHQHAPAGCRCDGKAPQHRTREAVAHGPRLRRIVRQRPEPIVWLHHQHPWAMTLERDDAGSGQHAAIESDVVRSETRGEPGRVQHLGVELRNLQP